MVGHYMLRFKHFNHGTCTSLIKHRLKKNMICGLPVQRNTLVCEKQNRCIINLSFDIFNKNNHKHSCCNGWNGATVLYCRSTHRFLAVYKHVILSQRNVIFPAVNLALGRAAWHSSDHNPEDRNASTAVDGSYRTDYPHCSQTKIEAWPTWMVDLGKVYEISHIKVTNRDGQ